MHVPDGWEVKPFSDLATINMGQSPESEFVNENQEGIAFLQGNADFGDVNPKELYWVTVPKKIAKKDDILISVRAPVGDMNIADKDYCIGRGLSALTIKKIDKKFGFYALFQERIQLDRLAQGSTFLAIGKNDFDKLLIKYPKEKKEQEKIAKILSTLDKSIEATNRLIEKEKNIKKALMQELLTNGIDKDGHIRTRATHTYKESELGFIPDEWEVVSLKEIAKVGSSKRIFEHEYVSEGVPFYRSTEIILKAHNKSVKSEIHISKDKFEEIEASYNVPQKDDILISAVGTIGVPYLVKNEQFYFKDGNLLWIQNIKINPNYLYLFVKSERFQDEINLIAGGSSQSALTIEKLSLLKVLYPKSIDEQKQIAKILTTQDKKIETEETNLAKLKELKKGLMNDLLSGKVRVKV